MEKVLKISPMTRVEGHLDIEVTVDKVSGQDQVVDAKASATMFRGFELILAGRDPRDAIQLTQRVCGVCPVSHAMASSMAVESALGVTAPANGRILRNLILGANFLQSHVLHFYHLAVPDYLDTGGVLAMSPWKPNFTTQDSLQGEPASRLMQSYLQALAIRRKSHEVGAIFGGRLPGVASFAPGGSSEIVTSDAISSFRSLLSEIRTFVDGSYLPDMETLKASFPQYSTLGSGCGNLLAFGVFDLDSAGTSKLLARGRYTDGELGEVDGSLIKEYVSHSWYASTSGDQNPASGATEPSVGKDGAYSWIKAPRYEEAVHEVGPLARMWVNGDYQEGISVMDRLAARALETKKIADAMDGWLDELEPGGPVYAHQATPMTAAGEGATEAPRGALGHWVQISGTKIARYQIVTPTAWNASPRDDAGQQGALEQALIGTPVSDVQNPLEVLRIVHSFDPCLACSVHAIRPKERLVVTRNRAGKSKGE